MLYSLINFFCEKHTLKISNSHLGYHLDVSKNYQHVHLKYTVNKLWLMKLLRISYCKIYLCIDKREFWHLVYKFFKSLFITSLSTETTMPPDRKFRFCTCWLSLSWLYITCFIMHTVRCITYWKTLAAPSLSLENDNQPVVDVGWSIYHCWLR